MTETLAIVAFNVIHVTWLIAIWLVLFTNTLHTTELHSK
jgi:hypothetical protein